MGGIAAMLLSARLRQKSLRLASKDPRPFGSTWVEEESNDHGTTRVPQLVKFSGFPQQQQQKQESEHCVEATLCRNNTGVRSGLTDFHVVPGRVSVGGRPRTRPLLPLPSESHLRGTESTQSGCLRGLPPTSPEDSLSRSGGVTAEQLSLRRQNEDDDELILEQPPGGGGQGSRRSSSAEEVEATRSDGDRRQRWTQRRQQSNVGAETFPWQQHEDLEGRSNDRASGRGKVVPLMSIKSFPSKQFFGENMTQCLIQTPGHWR